MRVLNCIALTIVIIGAINWGLVGFFNFNLVAFLFGGMSWLSRIIYALVGICGLYLITFYGRLADSEIEKATKPDDWRRKAAMLLSAFL